MEEEKGKTVKVGKYEPPMVARVHLDPVREMLQSCPTDQGGKIPNICVQTGS